MEEEGTKRPRGRPALEEARGAHNINMSEELWELLVEIAAMRGCRVVHLIEELVEFHYGEKRVPLTEREKDLLTRSILIKLGEKPEE